MGEGGKQKITAKAVKARLKEIGKDKDYAEDRQALAAYAALLDQQAEIQTLVVDNKWLATLAAAVQGELDHVSQTLTGRICELAERAATPLPQLTDELAALAARWDAHLKKMRAQP